MWNCRRIYTIRSLGCLGHGHSRCSLISFCTQTEPHGLLMNLFALELIPFNCCSLLVCGCCWWCRQKNRIMSGRSFAMPFRDARPSCERLLLFLGIDHCRQRVQKRTDGPVQHQQLPLEPLLESIEPVFSPFEAVKLVEISEMACLLCSLLLGCLFIGSGSFCCDMTEVHGCHGRN